jgi:hypothetical protein
MATRIYKRYCTQQLLAADSDLTLALDVAVGEAGYVALQVLIDNGAGAAPSDAPIGVWELHCSAGPGVRFTPVTGTVVTAELAKIAATGSALVDAWAILIGVPGSRCKFKYKRTSGGAGNSRATIDVSSW